MMMEEYFPLMKNEEINRDLMSFSRLYLKEIVDTIKERRNNAPIADFLKAIDAEGVELRQESTEDMEWLVDCLLRSKRGFNELYEYLKNTNSSLLDQMTLRNEGGVYKDVVENFKRYFLCDAPNLAMQRLKEMVEDIEVDSDEENANGNDDEKENIKKEEKKAEEVEDIEMESDVEKAKKEEAELWEKPDEFGYVETVLDKIAAVFDPEFAHSSLIRAYSVLKEVADPLKTPANAASMRYGPWARAILRQLPRMAPDKEELPDYPSVVYKFAHACENDPINRVAIMYLLPDYASKLDARNATLRARHEKGGIQLDLVKEVITECRPPASYAHLRKGPIQEYQTIAMPINLREYQKELVERANTGENTVIVAPTGSGKTVVAAQIMRHHVMQRKAANKPYRMIMVVPKIPLVEQQLKQLHQYMSDVVYSTYIHGDMVFEGQGKVEKVLCAELIVMTAQILINLLESVRSRERLFVSDMTMLILDECHHCCSNHPYAQLMSIIRDWQHPSKPQIVGLTASLGVGKDGTLQESSAYEHVVALLARMTATSISTVVMHEKELQSHVQLPVDDIKDVRRSTENVRPFTDKLDNFMSWINKGIRIRLKEMSELTNDSGAIIPKSLVTTKVDYRETEKYGGRIDAIKQAIVPMKDGAEKAHLNMALDILKVCNMTWGMNDLLPSSTVWLMMKNEMNVLRQRNPAHEFIQLFYNDYFSKMDGCSDEEDDCDMLRALRGELTSQMKRNRDSKVIIFVSTREMSKALSDYITERADVLQLGRRQCDFIISSKARGVGTVSQSPADQKAALNRFRNNELAVLVATTVAEEGLDVPECNLIIKYNMTGNVISLTQQRGRARAKDSRSVLIVLSGSVKQRELENANAERMMNHIVRKIRAEGGGKLERAVEKRRKEMATEEKQEMERARMKQDSLKSKNYEVMCSNCNQVLCDSYRIKHGASHYFACDPDIWNVVNIEYLDAKGKYIDTTTTVVAKVFCAGGTEDAKCGAELGKVVRFWSCYFPSLKCVSLQLKDKKDNKIVGLDDLGTKKKNWSEVSDTYFYISKITDQDVAEMMNALSTRNVELFELLESKCSELLKKSLRDAQRKYEQKKDEDELVGMD